MEKKTKTKQEFALGFDSLLSANYPEASKYFQNYLEIVNPEDRLAKDLLDKSNRFAEIEMDSDSVRNKLTYSRKNKKILQ